MSKLVVVVVAVAVASVGCITVNAPPPPTDPTPPSTIELTVTPSPPPTDTPTPATTPTPLPMPTSTPATPPTFPTVSTSTPVVTPIPTPSPDHNVVDLVARAKQSVVRLSKRGGSGSGSGVYFSVREEQRTPYILTNYHVVDNVVDVDILMADGQTHIGEAIWTDAQRDLAVIRLTCCLESHQLPVGITLANSVPLDGEEVVAMGWSRPVKWCKSASS